MTAVRDLAYATSRDYARLWELAQRQGVACIVDSQRGESENPPRELCQTVWYRGWMSVGSLSFTARDVEEFVEKAGSVNLEWILPPGETAERDEGERKPKSTPDDLDLPENPMAKWRRQQREINAAEEGDQ